MNDRWRMLQIMKRHDRLPFAMATIIAVDGSAYRHAGAKMLIGADGSQYGTISAGCLEEDLRHRAEDVIRNRRAHIWVYDLTSEDDLSWGRGAGCNGRVTVYIEPCEWGDMADAGEASVWSQVETHLDQGHRVLCARRLVRDSGEFVGSGRAPSGTQPLFYAENGAAFGNIDDTGLTVERLIPAFMQLFASKAEIALVPLPDANGELLLELYSPREQLYLFGAGPDTELLARLASELDFGVILIDPRSSRNNAVHFPTVQRRIIEHPETCLQNNPIPADSFVLIMTHSFQQDRYILRRLVQAPIHYVGILGSKSRTERLMSPDPVPDWLHAPVGLNIGAEGPEEIGVSILAELIKHRSGRQRRKESR